VKSNFHGFRSICGTYELLLFFSSNLFYLTRGNFTIFDENPNSWMKAKFQKKVINETFLIWVRSKANSSLVSCCIPHSYKKRNKYARNLCLIIFLKQTNIGEVLLITLASSCRNLCFKSFLDRPWLIHSNFVFQFTTTIKLILNVKAGKFKHNKPQQLQRIDFTPPPTLLY